MMGSGWDFAATLAEKHGGSGNGLFVRLASHGDKIVGAFVGDPYARQVHWTGERYEECTGDGCSLCEQHGRPSLRVAVNLYVPAEDDMKVIEGGTMWFKDLIKVRDKYGLDRWFFEIERHGQSGDSKTRYSILPESKIDAEAQAKIDGASQHALESLLSPRSSDGFDSFDKSRKPISDSEAKELTKGLKALPREALNAWLAEMGVERVRDLTGAQLPEAKAALERLENAADETTEVDPFGD